MQIKTTVRDTSHHQGGHYKKKTSVEEDTEKLEPLCPAGGNVNGIAAVENSMEVPQKIKHRVTTQPSNQTSKYTSKRI
jgi:hypothetical protein